MKIQEETFPAVSHRYLVPQDHLNLQLFILLTKSSHGFHLTALHCNATKGCLHLGCYDGLYRALRDALLSKISYNTESFAGS